MLNHNIYFSRLKASQEHYILLLHNTTQDFITEGPTEVPTKAICEVTGLGSEVEQKNEKRKEIKCTLQIRVKKCSKCMNVGRNW